MSEYTKGPWILDGVEIRASDSHPMDRICDMAPGFSEDDAKLIAAAPDLLEALQFMLTNANGRDLSQDESDALDLSINMAESAINKATTIQ